MKGMGSHEDSPNAPPKKRSQGASEPYRRRYGVIRRVGILGGRPGNAFLGSPDVIDGGEDAPLSPRGLEIYHWVIIGVILLGVALLALTVATR